MNVPLGYRFAAGYAGVRKKQKDDLAILVSDEPASAAGVFTQNQVRAAPVLRSQKHLSSSGGVVASRSTGGLVWSRSAGSKVVP